MVRVVLICGSLQRASTNQAALDVAGTALSSRGVEVSAFDGLGAIPPLNPDRVDEPGDAVLALRTQIGTADAVLIAAPEYAGAIAGVVKNALDWIVASGDLYGKPVAILSAGTSGGVFARIDLRRSGGDRRDGFLSASGPPSRLLAPLALEGRKDALRDREVVGAPRVPGDLPVLGRRRLLLGHRTLPFQKKALLPQRVGLRATTLEPPGGSLPRHLGCSSDDAHHRELRVRFGAFERSAKSRYVS